MVLAESVNHIPDNKYGMVKMTKTGLAEITNWTHAEVECAVLINAAQDNDYIQMELATTAQNIHEAMVRIQGNLINTLNACKTFVKRVKFHKKTEPADSVMNTKLLMQLKTDV